MFSFITTITKNKQRAIFLGAIAGIASAAAILSNVFLGNDNPVEQGGEKVVDYAVEQLTGEKVNIDFSPEK